MSDAAPPVSAPEELVPGVDEPAGARARTIPDRPSWGIGDPVRLAPLGRQRRGPGSDHPGGDLAGRDVLPRRGGLSGLAARTDGGGLPGSPPEAGRGPFRDAPIGIVLEMRESATCEVLSFKPRLRTENLRTWNLEPRTWNLLLRRGAKEDPPFVRSEDFRRGRVIDILHFRFVGGEAAFEVLREAQDVSDRRPIVDLRKQVARQLP